MEPTEKTLGGYEPIKFPAFNAEVDGKIDTGASSSSLHAVNIKVNGTNVTFQSDLLTPNNITLALHGTQEVHSADYGGDKRPLVQLDIEIGGVPLKGVPFNLNDRSKMDAKLLIGQDVLKAGGFTVNVNKNSEQELEKPMPESTTNNTDGVMEAIRVLADSNITLAELVRYLQTEAVNRIKE